MLVKGGIVNQVFMSPTIHNQRLKFWAHLYFSSVYDTLFWKKMYQLYQFYIGYNISLMFHFILFTGAEYDESFHTISSLVEWHNMSSTLIPHLIFLNIRQFVWRLELITELDFTNNKLRPMWFTVNCRHSAVMRRVLLPGCLFHLLCCHFQLEYNCWCFW